MAYKYSKDYSEVLKTELLFMPLMFHTFNFCVYTLIFKLSARVCVIGTFCTNTLHHAVFTQCFLCICLDGVTCAWLAACVLAETARSHLAVSHCAESGWAGRSWGKQRDTQCDWLSKAQGVACGQNLTCGSEDQKSINYKLKLLHFGFRAVWLIIFCKNTQIIIQRT